MVMKVIKSLKQQTLWMIYEKCGFKNEVKLLKALRGYVGNKKVIEIDLPKDIAFKPFIRYVKDKDIRDYMFMGRAGQLNSVSIYLYKNIIDRTYINIDDSGNFYSFNSQCNEYKLKAGEIVESKVR